MSTRLSGFTGTITVSNGTRFRIDLATDKTVLDKLAGIVVEPGNGQFWVNGGVSVVNCPISIAGTGGFDGAARGAIRLGPSVEYAGAINVAANASIGTTYAGNGNVFTFSGNINTNANTLTFFHTGAGEAGTILLTGGSTGTGTIIHSNAGSGALGLKIGDSSATATAQAVTFASNFQFANTTKTVVFQPGENRTVNVTGAISGAGNFSKTGDGTVVLSGSNTTWTGAATVDQGELRVTNQYALNTSTTTVNANGKLTVNLDFGKQTNKYYPGKVAGTGEFNLLGCGNVLGSSRPINEYLSEFTGTVVSGANTRFRIDQASEIATLNQLAGIVVENNAEFWVMAGGQTVTAPLTLSGYGNAQNGYSFDDTARRGAIRLDANVTYAGTLSLNADASVGAYGGSGNKYLFSGEINTNSHTLDIYGSNNPGNFYITGNVAGNGTIRYSNKYALDGDNNNSLLFIGDSSAAAASVTQTIAANIAVDNTTKVLTFQPGENRTIDVSGTISGAGNIVKTGAGELILSGTAANTNTGDFTIEAGTVRLSNSATLGSGELVINPGAALTLDSSWSAQLTNKSILNSGFLELSLLLGDPSSTNAILTLTEASTLNTASVSLTADADTPAINFGDEFLLILAPSFNDNVLDSISFDPQNNSLLGYEGGRWLYSLESLTGGQYGIMATASDGAAVPEPASCLLLLIGLLGIGAYYRRPR